jgi:hypothetical protein
LQGKYSLSNQYHLGTGELKSAAHLNEALSSIVSSEKEEQR